MSDLAEEAHMMYTKLLAYQMSKIGQEDDESCKHVFQQRQNITALVLQFLCVCQPKERFKYVEFTKIISDSVEQQIFDPEKAMLAFNCLEDYITLLYLMPWKKEYHKIKKYGGHYQTRIASHIKGSEVILRLVGFTDLATGLMILNHHTKTDVLQYIAFECLVASAECLIISQIYRKIDQSKISIKEVVQLRLQNSGNAEGIISVIEAKYGKISKDMEQENLVNRSRSGRNSTKRVDSALFHDKLQEHLRKAESIGKTASHNDIPYMDEDTKEIDRKPENFEDHLIASLQLVSDKEAPPPPCSNETKNSQNLRPSQEWSFVREGLEKNYGKQYFDGPREDILQQPEQSRPNDPLYVELVTEPPYENAKHVVPPAFRDRKPAQVVAPFSSNIYPGIPSRGYISDSAYSSPGLFYPPEMNSTDLIQRGQYQPKSEVLMKRDLNQVVEPPKTPTAPLLRKISDTSSASRTYPGKVQPQYENIRKYHKPTPSSMPIENRLNNRTNQIPFTDSPVVRSNYSMDPGGNRVVREKTQVPNSLNYPIRTSSSHMNKSPVIDYTNKANQWQCIHCTMYNDYSASVCKMCSKTRDRTEVDGPSVGEVLRVCSKCTLENSPDSRTCTACGNELKGVQTVI